MALDLIVQHVHSQLEKVRGRCVSADGDGANFLSRAANGGRMASCRRFLHRALDVSGAGLQICLQGLHVLLSTFTQHPTFELHVEERLIWG